MNNKELMIPETFPLKQQYTLPQDCEKNVIVGMDSGVSNLAFCECILKKENGLIQDLEIQNLHYFEQQIKNIYPFDARYYFIAEKYWELFAHKPVMNVTFEVLPINSTIEEKKLSGIIAAQKTTDIITFICRCLSHYYNAVPPKSIKKTLTGNGNATKQDMMAAAYALTGNPEFLKNDHLADAFADCFYFFVSEIKKEIKTYRRTAPPEKYAHTYGLDLERYRLNRDTI